MLLDTGQKMLRSLIQVVELHPFIAICVHVVGGNMYLITRECHSGSILRPIGIAAGWANLLATFGIMGLLAERRRIWVFCLFVTADVSLGYALQYGLRSACGE